MAIGSLFKKKTAHRAYLEPHGIELEVASDKTLLQAALDQGIALPHSCRVGSCTTCKCQLLEGRVKEMTDSAYVLSMQDLDQNYILACQSRLKSDVRVKVGDLAERMPEEFQAVISGVRDLTHDIKELTLQLERPIFYKAGQYADLLVGHLDRARSYSFASAPAGGGNLEVQFQIRHVPGGAFTDWLFAADRTGTKLRLQGPAGQFYLRDSPRRMLCIAGGSGMAPIQSLLLDLKAQGTPRQVVYLFGARTQRDLFSLDVMADLARGWKGDFQFLPVLSAEADDSDWTGKTGLVTDWALEALAGDDAVDAYLCGPPAMIDAAIARLSDHIPADRIYCDRFTDAGHP